MNPFSTDDLSRMATTQESSMFDTCVHMERLTEKDAYNIVEEVFQDRLSYPCGYDPRVTRGDFEVMDYTQVPMRVNRVRMPLSVDGVIKPVDRLRITHRFGVELDTPIVLEIVGDPERGPSGLLFNTKMATE